MDVVVGGLSPARGSILWDKVFAAFCVRLCRTSGGMPEQCVEHADSVETFFFVEPRLSDSDSGTFHCFCLSYSFFLPSEIVYTR